MMDENDVSALPGALHIFAHVAELLPRLEDVAALVQAWSGPQLHLATIGNVGFLSRWLARQSAAYVFREPPVLRRLWTDEASALRLYDFVSRINEGGTSKTRRGWRKWETSMFLQYAVDGTIEHTGRLEEDVQLWSPEADAERLPARVGLTWLALQRGVESIVARACASFPNDIIHTLGVFPALLAVVHDQPRMIEMVQDASPQGALNVHSAYEGLLNILDSVGAVVSPSLRDEVCPPHRGRSAAVGMTEVLRRTRPPPFPYEQDMTPPNDESVLLTAALLESAVGLVALLDRRGNVTAVARILQPDQDGMIEYARHVPKMMREALRAEEEEEDASHAEQRHEMLKLLEDLDRRLDSGELVPADTSEDSDMSEDSDSSEDSETAEA